MFEGYLVSAKWLFHAVYILTDLDYLAQSNLSCIEFIIHDHLPHTKPYIIYPNSLDHRRIKSYTSVFIVKPFPQRQVLMLVFGVVGE
jgi:hypothetical protein